MGADKSQARMSGERDQGLALAIAKAGSIGKLARALGISQPAISAWTRVPSDRVAMVEKVTGVERHLLRPDLYQIEKNKSSSRSPVADELAQAQARSYLLLANLLLRAPSQVFLDELAQLKGDVSPLGHAIIVLADAAGSVNADQVAHEYFNLFVGVGRGEILPFASFYQTGFLNERPLARVREDLRRLGVERQPDVFEPEDHLGALLEVMAGLVGGAFEAEAGAAERFYRKHIERWAGRCFVDLGKAESARFYRAVAAYGQVFMAIESEAMSLPAPLMELDAPALSAAL